MTSGWEESLFQFYGGSPKGKHFGRDRQDETGGVQVSSAVAQGAPIGRQEMMNGPWGSNRWNLSIMKRWAELAANCRGRPPECKKGQHPPQVAPALAQRRQSVEASPRSIG